MQRQAVARGGRFPAADLRHAMAALKNLGVPGAGDVLAMLRGVEDGATVAESRAHAVLLSASRPGRSPLIDELTRIADVRYITAGEARRNTLRAIVSLGRSAFLAGGQADKGAIASEARVIAEATVRGRVVAACGGAQSRRTVTAFGTVLAVYVASVLLRTFIARSPRFEGVREDDRRMRARTLMVERAATARSVLDDLGAFPGVDPDEPVADDMTFRQLRRYTRATLLARATDNETALYEEAQERPDSEVGMVMVVLMRAFRVALRTAELANFYVLLPLATLMAVRLAWRAVYAAYVCPLCASSVERLGALKQYLGALRARRRPQRTRRP